MILILSGGGVVPILIYLFSSIHAWEGYRILGTSFTFNKWNSKSGGKRGGLWLVEGIQYFKGWFITYPGFFTRMCATLSLSLTSIFNWQSTCFHYLFSISPRPTDDISTHSCLPVLLSQELPHTLVTLQMWYTKSFVINFSFQFVLKQQFNTYFKFRTIWHLQG